MDQIRIFNLIAIRVKDLLPGHTFIFAGDLAQRIAGHHRVKFLAPGVDVQVQDNVTGPHIRIQAIVFVPYLLFAFSSGAVPSIGPALASPVLQ
jgi:hypothetical protein